MGCSRCNAFCVSYFIVTEVVRFFISPVRWLVQRYRCTFVLYCDWRFSKVSSMYLECKLFESSPRYHISCLSTFVTLYSLSKKMLRLYIEITTNSFKIQISPYVLSIASFSHGLVQYALHIKLCQINTLSLCFGIYYACKLDVHGFVHHNIKLIERTNKMQPCSRIYYSNVS